MGWEPRAHQWVKGLFATYYAQNPVTLPYAPEKREFGYGLQGKIEKRHVGFENAGEFNAFLQNQTPLYISASSAEYDFPTAQPMEAKQLQGNDLIYEFDADDLDTACKQTHDAWKCAHCNAEGKGRVKKCTSCGKGTQLEEWVCEKCLGATKTRTTELVKMLQDDFHFEWGKNVFVNFSGSKGYHVHVRAESIFKIPKTARIELMDYISWHDIDVAALGFYFDGKQFHCPRYTNATGHSKRILEEVLRMIETSDETDWAIASNTAPRTVKSFLENREHLFKDVHSGVLPALPGKKTEPFWNAVLATIVETRKLPIDRQTSGDIYKLVRVPNTLHGSTGLLAKTLSPAEWEAFSPLKDAAVLDFGKPRTIFVKKSPALQVGEGTLPLTQGEEVTVPQGLAVYLVGWGAAELR